MHSRTSIGALITLGLAFARGCSGLSIFRRIVVQPSWPESRPPADLDTVAQRAKLAKDPSIYHAADVWSAHGPVNNSEWLTWETGRWSECKIWDADSLDIIGCGAKHAPVAWMEMVDPPHRYWNITAMALEDLMLPAFVYESQSLTSKDHRRAFCQDNSLYRNRIWSYNTAGMGDRKLCVSYTKDYTGRMSRARMNVLHKSVMKCLRHKKSAQATITFDDGEQIQACFSDRHFGCHNDATCPNGQRWVT